MSTSLSTPQGSELDVYSRQGTEGKKLTQVHYLCMFSIFHVRGKSEEVWSRISGKKESKGKKYKSSEEKNKE